MSPETTCASCSFKLPLFYIVCNRNSVGGGNVVKNKSSGNTFECQKEGRHVNGRREGREGSINTSPHLSRGNGPADVVIACGTSANRYTHILYQREHETGLDSVPMAQTELLLITFSNDDPTGIYIPFRLPSAA